MDAITPFVLGMAGTLLFIFDAFLLIYLATKPNKKWIRDLVRESLIFISYHT